MHKHLNLILVYYEFQGNKLGIKINFFFFSENDKDSFLMMFLYARKMNEISTLSLIQNYYQFRKKHHLWFNQLEAYDPKIQMAIQDGFPSVLPNLDR